MRILLVGEYSNFHNSLKEGLEELGHHAVIISDNDFKNYPIDIDIYAKYFQDNYLLNKIRQAIYRISKIDVAQIEVGVRFYANRKKLMGFDVVQLVNEYAIQSPPAMEIRLLEFLFKNNKKSFLVSCGDDYICVNYMLAGKFKYSVLTPCETYPNANHCKFTLKFATKPFKKLHDYVYKNINAVVAGDMDYYIPIRNHPKCAGLIPYAINIAKHQFIPVPITDKIVIFHGINVANYYKKGNYIFEQALDIIQRKFADKVDIVTTRSVPYPQYIEMYNRAHILLDQVFAYDQGYNALEAMAKGKVVFTGAETEFMEHYNLTERVAVNALPDAEAIAADLEYLIHNPDEILAIGKRARAFVEREHDYVKIAQKYLEVWSKY
ncbi:MAG TPA: glycosyltransferase [Flavobacterium sp.]|jgi:glycosyltransferase involved in cell wall biosynthesis|nr:glycosyltransferase [Flavobacterium sp.]